MRVGNLEAPFAEQTIVHGGRQSMPVDYNNIGSGSAEIVRSWDTPQNWTVNGGNALVLYFRGKATNRDARPFVEVEDSKGNGVGLFRDSPSDVKTTAWIEWKIPLTVFGGVDMTRVKKLRIHIMEMKPSGPGVGTTGLIFLDDIRVIKPIAGGQLEHGTNGTCRTGRTHPPCGLQRWALIGPPGIS